MALVRCNDHQPKGRTNEYGKSVEPLGYPETAAICGSKHCDHAGFVWLTTEEMTAYHEGQRIFEIPSSAAKLKVK